MRTSPRCAHGSTRPTSKFLRWISSPTSDQRSRPSPAQARDGRKAGEGEASIARSLRKDPPNETPSRYLQQHYGIHHLQRHRRGLRPDRGVVELQRPVILLEIEMIERQVPPVDRKSTRLNSSH